MNKTTSGVKKNRLLYRMINQQQNAWQTPEPLRKWIMLAVAKRDILKQCVPYYETLQRDDCQVLVEGWLQTFATNHIKLGRIYLRKKAVRDSHHRFTTDRQSQQNGDQMLNIQHIKSAFEEHL